jgi:hypothetical protein
MSTEYTGWKVTAVYEDEKGKRYKGDGNWLVVTRRADFVQGHRFKTQAEAQDFAAPFQYAYSSWLAAQAHEAEVLRTASTGLYRAACACGWWSRALRDYGKAYAALDRHQARTRKVAS